MDGLPIRFLQIDDPMQTIRYVWIFAGTSERMNVTVWNNPKANKNIFGVRLSVETVADEFFHVQLI